MESRSSKLEDRVQEVANDLLGSCQSLTDVATKDEINDRAFCEALDDKVLKCSCCNWWHETIEVQEDGLCVDCADQEEDNDD